MFKGIRRENAVAERDRKIVKLFYSFIKSRMGLLLLGILAVIGIFTVISAKNYADGLVSVKLISPEKGTIRSELTVNGNVYCQKTMEIELPAGCQVEEVYAQKGQYLEAGASLLKLREADVQILYWQKQVQKETLEKIVEKEDAQGELAVWQLVNLEEEIAELEALIASGGMIQTEAPCQVISYVCQAGDKTQNGSGIELGLVDGGYYVEWSVTPREQAEYAQTVFLDDEKVELWWDIPLFENGWYVYRSELPEEFVEAAIAEKIEEAEKAEKAEKAGKAAYQHGQPLEVKLQWESERYNSIIPLSCIRYDSQGIAYVYELAERERIYGKEYYANMVSIAIQEENGRYAGVITGFDYIISNPSEELRDGAAVRFVE